MNYWPLIVLSTLVVQRSVTAEIFRQAGAAHASSTLVSVTFAEVFKITISFSAIIARRYAITLRTTKRRSYAAMGSGDEASSMESLTSLIPDTTEVEKCARWSRYEVPERQTLLLIATLMVLQNNLFLYAGLHLHPIVFQSGWQLRLVTTVVFSAYMLQTGVTSSQLLGVIGVVIGVVIVQVPHLLAYMQPTQQIVFNTLDVDDKQWFRQLIPFMSLLTAATSGGIALVLLQRHLSTYQSDLLESTLQISLYSIGPVLLSSAFLLREESSQLSLLAEGATWDFACGLAIAALFLLNAASTKLAGAVATNFAGSFSILLTSLCASTIGPRDIPFPNSALCTVIGTGLILAGTQQYYAHQCNARATRAPQVHCPDTGGRVHNIQCERFEVTIRAEERRSDIPDEG